MLTLIKTLSSHRMHSYTRGSSSVSIFCLSSTSSCVSSLLGVSRALLELSCPCQASKVSSGSISTVISSMGSGPACIARNGSSVVIGVAFFAAADCLFYKDVRNFFWLLCLWDACPLFFIISTRSRFCLLALLPSCSNFVDPLGERVFLSSCC